MGTHMGGEGATWIGQSPFSAEKHVFQNLGDGTFQHSGSLAIRAAAISGANITYKILYNDAVGMTGGQPVEGRPSVAAIAREVSAEGAKKVVVVTDDPKRAREQVAGMALEGDRDRRHAFFPSPAEELLNNLPVTEVNAVEHAPGHDRSADAHRAYLRPDMRCGAATTPEARPPSGTSQARFHQRGCLRGLRRLFDRLELYLPETGRDGIRTQAGRRSVELQ